MEKFLGYEVFLVTKKCCFYAAFLITQMAVVWKGETSLGNL